MSHRVKSGWPILLILISNFPRCAKYTFMTCMQCHKCCAVEKLICNLFCLLNPPRIIQINLFLVQMITINKGSKKFSIIRAAFVGVSCFRLIIKFDCPEVKRKLKPMCKCCHVVCFCSKYELQTQIYFT